MTKIRKSHLLTFFMYVFILNLFFFFFFTSAPSCLSSSLLPSSFVVCQSSCTRRRQSLSKALVYYCFLLLRRIGEYIALYLFYSCRRTDTMGWHGDSPVFARWKTPVSRVEAGVDSLRLYFGKWSAPMMMSWCLMSSDVSWHIRGLSCDSDVIRSTVQG